MSDVYQNSVVYITKLTHVDDRVVKYPDEKSRQFREMFRELAATAKANGLEMLFAEIHDLDNSGHLKKVYRLLPSSEALEFSGIVCDFVPRVAVNKVKDLLYQHPGYQRLINAGTKVINVEEVASLGNKAVSRQIAGAFMPASFSLPTSWSADKRLEEINSFIQKNGMVVAKPLRLNGAEGIVFLDTTDMTQIDQIARNGEPYIIQQFVETSEGIPNFIEGRHDLRIFVCNGKKVAGALRQPEAGGFASNTAQGGSITFFSIEELPESVLEYCEKVLDIIRLPVYSFVSLDFFFGNGRWYLIEINDQPGVPAQYQNKQVATTLQESLIAVYKDGL